MKLSRAVAQFLDETRMAKAKTTVSAYGGDLQTLVAMARPDSILSFNDDLVTQYFLACSAGGQGMATLHRKATALNQFARWGMRKGLWVRNPADDPRFKFKRPEALPKPFDQLESGRLMALALSERDTLIRALLYYTGLRVSPICNLRMGDISFAPLVVGGSSLPGAIRTTSKGGKRQLVPMAPELASLLQAWMQKNAGQSYDPLFAGRGGGCLTRSTVERLTRDWGKQAQVSNCIPHRFRHTYATDLRRQGVELDVIQRLLGHSNISTTQIYAKVADEELVAAVLGRSHTALPYASPVTPTAN